MKWGVKNIPPDSNKGSSAELNLNLGLCSSTEANFVIP